MDSELGESDDEDEVLKKRFTASVRHHLHTYVGGAGDEDQAKDAEMIALELLQLPKTAFVAGYTHSRLSLVTRSAQMLGIVRRLGFLRAGEPGKRKVYRMWREGKGQCMPTATKAPTANPSSSLNSQLLQLQTHSQIPTSTALLKSLNQRLTQLQIDQDEQTQLVKEA